MRARLGWGQAPTGWPQPHLPGWAPLMDPGPFPLQAARSLGRWLWPTLAVSGFVAVIGLVLRHDAPAPGLSSRGLLTVALAAVVVVLLTLHRRYGPRPLARALAEYAVVFACWPVLLATTGVPLDQPAGRPPRQRPGPAQAAAGDDQPAVIQTIDHASGLAPRWSGASLGAARWLSTCGAGPASKPPPRARRWPPRPAPRPRLLLSTWRSHS